ncbi:MAG TPA: hypothetical protein VF805_02865, partial [Anaeromyxobacteraceae bacterium]
MNEGSTRDRIAALLHLRWVWVAAAALALLGAAGGALPLLEVPGFELGLVAALLAALVLGPALGIAAARRELSAAPPRVGAVSVLRPFAATAAVLLGLVALLFLASAVRAALATPCRPLAGAALFALVAT